MMFGERSYNNLNSRECIDVILEYLESSELKSKAEIEIWYYLFIVKLMKDSFYRQNKRKIQEVLVLLITLFNDPYLEPSLYFKSFKEFDLKNESKKNELLDILSAELV